MSSEFFNGEWVRKAAPAEVALEDAHQEGHLLIWYQLDLCSLNPVSEAQVKTTTEYFYRKVPTMSLCFGTRNGEKWFRRATNPNVDFQVVQNIPLKELRESLLGKHYNSDTGPLFCVRFLPSWSDTDTDILEHDPNFSYKFRIFCGFHHSVTDGTSNMNLMGIFVSLLNDVVSGKEIDINERIGFLANHDETNNLIMEKKTMLENDPGMMKKIAEDLKVEKEQVPFIIKAFPKAGNDKFTTSIVKILDRNTTAKFLQHCRQEKVTVNSAITAIANMAIVDMAVENGSVQDSYLLKNFHCLNFRRYWDSAPPKALGLHMGYPLVGFSKTPRNVRDNFWEYARDVGQSLKKDIVTGRLLFDKAYAMINPSENNSENLQYACEYITSNMGDITPLVTEGGSHVRVMNLLRGSSFHFTEFPVLVNCHTFRGIFSIIFDYNIAALQKDVAENMCSLIVKYISEV